MTELFEKIFEPFGLKTLSFIVDYKANGQDKHGPFQTLCPDNNIIKAANALHDGLVREGWIPQMIAYIPGDHTMDELTAMINSGDTYDFVPVFVSGEVLKEAQTSRT